MREWSRTKQSDGGDLGYRSIRHGRLLDRHEPGHHGRHLVKSAIWVPRHMYAQADPGHCRQGRRDASQSRPVHLTSDRSYRTEPAGDLFCGIYGGVQKYYEVRSPLLATCEVPPQLPQHPGVTGTVPASMP